MHWLGEALLMDIIIFNNVNVKNIHVYAKHVKNTPIDHENIIAYINYIMKCPLIDNDYPIIFIITCILL